MVPLNFHVSRLLSTPPSSVTLIERETPRCTLPSLKATLRIEDAIFLLSQNIGLDTARVLGRGFSPLAAPLKRLPVSKSSHGAAISLVEIPQYPASSWLR
jgi:hypothetical protein